MILHNERKLFNNTNFIMQVLTVWLFVEFVEAHLKVYGLLISNTVTTNFVFRRKNRIYSWAKEGR